MSCIQNTLNEDVRTQQPKKEVEKMKKQKQISMPDASITQSRKQIRRNRKKTHCEANYFAKRRSLTNNIRRLLKINEMKILRSVF